MAAYNDITDAVGKTPLVLLRRVAEGLDARLWAKCEFLNPGGSTKDRIAAHMVKRAEEQGLIRPGDTLIEASSGNTGIGLAMVGAARGYRVIITMPEKMSQEKEVVLRALGAEIIRTPSEVAYDDPASHISVARRLQATHPRAHILDQYSNPHNPQAHAEGTAQEIYDDLQGQVDMVVVGVGTGGSVSGLARAMRQLAPSCIMVGVDPYGSILSTQHEDSPAPYKVEGIGYDFIPKVLQRDLVMRWVKTRDAESFQAARRLIREEGLLCGGSSGAVLCAALRESVQLKRGQNCVLVLADGVRNYLTKFLDDGWLEGIGD